jgi:hypothetical protein
MQPWLASIRNRCSEEGREQHHVGEGDEQQTLRWSAQWEGDGAHHGRIQSDVTNADRIVLWAHNAKKQDVRRAAEDAAERLEEHEEAGQR